MIGFATFLLIASALLPGAVCSEKDHRSKRYLLTPTDTQWGVYTAVSIPLPPYTTTSVAWFFEASYYSVANATYWHPLLGDIEDLTVSRSRDRRDKRTEKFITRSVFYQVAESMLERHGLPGRACLLRAVCEHGAAHALHNGLVGDLLYVALTPSSSEYDEDVEDCFYEAEYSGEQNDCDYFGYDCPKMESHQNRYQQLLKHFDFGTTK